MKLPSEKIVVLGLAVVALLVLTLGRGEQLLWIAAPPLALARYLVPPYCFELAGETVCEGTPIQLAANIVGVLFTMGLYTAIVLAVRLIRDIRQDVA